MADSQVQDSGEVDPNLPVSTEPDSSDAEGGANEAPQTPEYDFEAFNERLEAVKADAVSKADLAQLKRQAGHIPGVMSRLEKIEQALAQPKSDPQVGELAQRFDRFVDSLGNLLSEEDRAALRPQPGDTSQEIMDRLDRLQDRIENPPADEGADDEATTEDGDEVDPVRAAVLAQWNLATQSALDYAVSKGLDADTLKADTPVWERAFQAHPEDPTAAMKAVMVEIDTRVAAQERREERAEAAEGGDDGQRASRKGALTREAMQKMTPAELLAYPREERAAALVRG